MVASKLVHFIIPKKQPDQLQQTVINQKLTDYQS